MLVAVFLPLTCTKQSYFFPKTEPDKGPLWRVGGWQ